ncbi:helix-turn-helix transcriptional regulator [Kineococcus sp. SYSU DK005]|uniref:helix-turn-helix transcriptional regulator n=1 Tax=Kineococcus sp. SYSU DK005 TaxID=3383126 RepID=UPI003D7EE8EF
MALPASATSSRLLALLSLLQSRRDWPGPLLAQRLEVSERTVRRDVDRLRELGYPINAVKGPDGGYRLEAGAQLPPLLFDDEQAVALAVALQLAVVTGAGIEEAAARALSTLSQVMPSHLTRRIDALRPIVLDRAATAGTGQAEVEQVDVDLLLAINQAVQLREGLRFDYDHDRTTATGDGRDDGGSTASTEPTASREVHPHHLVLRAGRWYLLAWEPGKQDWRTYRVDRMRLRVPGGARFSPREVPGGDAAAYVAGRFKGSPAGKGWPCTGVVIVHRSAAELAPFVGDGTLESLGAHRCRLVLGSWSWMGLAASLARLDADIEVVGPQDLRAAFSRLAERGTRAAAPPSTSTRSGRGA